MPRLAVVLAVVAVLVAWLAVTPQYMLPKDPENEKTILLFDGVCNLCDGLGSFRMTYFRSMTFTRLYP